MNCESDEDQRLTDEPSDYDMERAMLMNNVDAVLLEIQGISGKILDIIEDCVDDWEDEADRSYVEIVARIERELDLRIKHMAACNEEMAKLVGKLSRFNWRQ